MALSARRRAQLTQAAELRAGGMAWEALAAKLQLSVETVRAWPTQYAEWASLLREAEAAQAYAARNEALHVLRQLLRSDDEKVRRDAAKHLLGRLTTPKAPPVRDSEQARVQAYVAGLDDAALAGLLAELAAPTAN